MQHRWLLRLQIFDLQANLKPVVFSNAYGAKPKLIKHGETPNIMSLATSIKEFSDILNQISTANEINGTFSYITYLQEFFLFSIKNLVGAILSILSFNWVRDFSYLPLLAPQLNPSSYFEDSYFEDPLSHIISFSRQPSLLEHGSNMVTAGYGAEQFISGFINSFFFSLPFSLPHLISMKRFLSQGVSAGVSSVLGTIAAHSLFLIGVLYGLRFLIIPWFSVEPLNYVVGIFIVVAIVNELVQEKKVYIVPKSKQRQGNLLKIGALNFLLTWCEESTVFHSFSNLTLNAHNTYLDLYPSGTSLSPSLAPWGSPAFSSLLIHTTYLVAFILGNCLFSFLFYFLFLQSTQYISQWTGFALAKVARTINKVVLFLIVAFTLSSFPYYGLDYLLGKVGGFLPEDPAYMETILSPTVIRKLDRDFSDQTSKNGNKKKVVPLDVNYFDQGVYLYLETPLEDEPKEDFISNESRRVRGLDEEVTPTTSMESKNSFEELNYRGEYAWTFHTRYKKNGSKDKNGFLSGIAGGQAFKKPKNHYMELKLQSDKRQAEAARRAADKIPLGRLSEWKEGVLPPAYSSSKKDTGSPLPHSPGDNIVDEANQMEDFLGRSLTERLLGASANSHAPRSGAAPNKTEGFVQAGRIQNQPLLNQKFVRASDNLDSASASGLLGGEAMNLSQRNPISEYVTELTESISPFEDDEGEKLLPIENLIKARYIFNPVYRTLLKTDIDAFLGRQPSQHSLAANQEYNLAKKRQLLEKYYNWLRYYSPFEKELERLYEIPQTKSFVDSVYHQQFKGTLQIARRLFSVTFDPAQTPAQSTTSPLKAIKKQRRVLSYDQTLYADLDADVVDGGMLLHEQLFSDNDFAPHNRPAMEVNKEKRRVESKSESGTRARPLVEENKTKSITTFEDLESSSSRRGQPELRSGKNKQAAANDFDVELKNKEFLSGRPRGTRIAPEGLEPNSLLHSSLISRSPFIEESNSSPVYAGWDDTLRQFVVTNKFILK